MSGVKRHQHERADLQMQRPKPIPLKTQEDERLALEQLLADDINNMDIETGDELRFLRSGVQPAMMRKLYRGHLNIEAELDLHGLTVSEAKQTLAGFLYDCADLGLRCVRIIHGKGYNSPDNTPILKGKVNGWLQQYNEVLGFISASPADGGTGAVLLLLRKRQD